MSNVEKEDIRFEMDSTRKGIFFCYNDIEGQDINNRVRMRANNGNYNRQRNMLPLYIKGPLS